MSGWGRSLRKPRGSWRRPLHGSPIVFIITIITICITITTVHYHHYDLHQHLIPSCSRRRSHGSLIISSIHPSVHSVHKRFFYLCIWPSSPPFPSQSWSSTTQAGWPGGRSKPWPVFGWGQPHLPQHDLLKILLKFSHPDHAAASAGEAQRGGGELLVSCSQQDPCWSL